MTWRFFAVLVLLVGCSSALKALPTHDKNDIPNPSEDPEGCGISEPRRICDPNGVLGEEGTRVVETALKERENQVVGPCNGDENTPFQVAVAIVAAMKLNGQSADAAAAEYGEHIHDSWGVGDARCNNGVLLFLSRDDRRVHITTGGGVPALTDNQIDAVIARMRPHLKKGNYLTAVEKAVNDIFQVLGGNPLVSEEKSSPTVGVLIVLAFAGFFIFSLCQDWYNQRQYNSCRQQLTRLEDARARALASQFATTSCPICFEDFKEDVKPSLLMCGHEFCPPCLTAWFRSNRDESCPVCRDHGGYATEAAAPSLRDDRERLFWQDYQFRVHRLHRRYPRFVSRDMAERWSADRSTQRTSLVQDAQFVAARPVTKSSSSSSGKSSRSFGGGRRSGGRSRGGGW